MIGAHRRIALYPGGFKPPHRGHLLAIEHLESRGDLDEVVVIVSNRARLVPGTSIALEADVCAELLRQLLAWRPWKISDIRVEVARHRATDHALEYINHSRSGDHLWFCLGEKDHDHGDPRFNQVESLASLKGVRAETLILPKHSPPVRATELRNLIFRTNWKHSDVVKFLPEYLEPVQMHDYCQRISRAGRLVSEIIRPKVLKFLIQEGYSTIRSLSVIDPDAIDPEYRLIATDNAVRKVKYAGDTVTAGCFINDRKPKPARRLAVEKRVIKYLRRQWRCETRWRLPEIESFNKSIRLSVVNEPAGISCATLLAPAGVPRHQQRHISRLAGQFLATLHQTPPPEEPFWGTEACERHLWLQQTTSEKNLETFENYRNSIVHFGYSPSLLRWDGEHLGITNLEQVSSHGDPLADVQGFLSKLEKVNTDKTIHSAFIGGYDGACGPYSPIPVN